MRIRSFVVAYALLLAILLFADRRPSPAQQDRYSRVVDLTDESHDAAPHAATGTRTESRTRIIAPGTLIPGTWKAGQIPPERLVAPLVVLDLSPAIQKNLSKPISLDDIAAWETHHGMIPQGAVVAIRRAGPGADLKKDNPKTSDPSTGALASEPFPLTRQAAMFLIEARYAIGFAVETPVDLSFDRTLARQLALHGSYVVEGAARFTLLPPTGSLVIVAPAKNRKSGEAAVRLLAMVQ
ncbi:MAG: cyclase family protein [Terriglobales bacterium]